MRCFCQSRFDTLSPLSPPRAQGGWRPGTLQDLVPQDAVSRHSVAQTIENFVPVQILDVPVPPVVMYGVQDRILQRLVEQILMDDMEQEIEAPRPTSSYVLNAADGQ